MEKRKNIKLILTVISILLLALILYIVEWTGIREIRQFNELSDTGILLGQKANANGTVGKDNLFNSTLSVTVRLSSYPDVVIGESRVTSIQITGSDAHALGIRIGDKRGFAHNKLKEAGYDVTNNSSLAIRAVKGKISIAIELDENECVKLIVVMLDKTNVFRVQF